MNHSHSPPPTPAAGLAPCHSTSPVSTHSRVRVTLLARATSVEEPWRGYSPTSAGAAARRASSVKGVPRATEPVQAQAVLSRPSKHCSGGYPPAQGPASPEKARALRARLAGEAMAAPLAAVLGGV